MHILITAVISVFLIGCSSTQSAKTPQLLNEARIWINQTAALEVLEARASEDTLYVRFNAYSKDMDEYNSFMAKASWKQEKGSRVNLSKNIVVPLDIIETEAWQDDPEKSKPVKSLSKDHWRIIRFKLAHELAPKEEGMGAVIRSDEDELILYYDSQNHLQVLDIKEKPAEIKIKETLTQLELTQKIVEVAKAYLEENEIQASRVLLSLDNEDDYANPFVYVDTEQSLAVNLKLPLRSGKKYRNNLLNKGFKSADYLLFDSYVLGMWRRPVTSSIRLFSWTRSMSRDVIKPPLLSMIESNELKDLYQGDPMDLNAFEERIEKEINIKRNSGTIDFLIGGDEFFTRMIDAIISAKKSIYVRIFIFDNDDYAVSIADLLKKKSNEGVEIKVILDGMGQVMGEGKLPETLPPSFIPPASMEHYLRMDSKIQVRVRPNAWFKADHTKTIIIDEEFFFTGGMNIGREYRFDWHDLMMEVRGSITEEIVKEFEIAWAHSGPWGDLGYLKNILDRPTSYKEGSGYPMHAIYTRLNDPQIYKAQLIAIREAKKYIYVHNSYFSDDTIIYELIRARRRGVDVRIVLPIHGNHNIMNAGNIVSANTMFRNGVRVYFYPGMSHIKAAVYDGWLCTGSANFDKLSFMDNLELNLATSDKQTVDTILERLFEEDFKKSMEMTEVLETGWKERLAEFLAEQL